MRVHRRRRRKSSQGNKRKIADVIVLSDSEEKPKAAQSVPSASGDDAQINGDETRTEVEANQDPVHTPVDDSEKILESHMLDSFKTPGCAPNTDSRGGPQDEVPEQMSVPHMDKATDGAPDVEMRQPGSRDQDMAPSELPPASGTVVPQPIVVLNLQGASNHLNAQANNCVTLPMQEGLGEDAPLGTATTSQQHTASTDDINGATGSVTMGTRETTFQKLRERIMMNKLQKSSSVTRETRSPIRPSLYRKYPKRKSERNRKQVKQSKASSKQEMTFQENQREMPCNKNLQELKQEPPCLQPKAEDYQRYYLQSFSQYVPAQQIIKPEPTTRITEDVKSEELKEVKSAQCMVVAQSKDLIDVRTETMQNRRLLKREFGENETVKNNSEEAERIWLRALKEEGVKEVKRTESTSGINHEYQNEYYKFIEGMGFGNKKRDAQSSTDQETKTKDEKMESSTMPSTNEASELSEFCTSLMARHPLYLQQPEAESSNQAQKGQVVFVPRLVPYMPSLMPVQGQGQCKCEGPCQGQCQMNLGQMNAGQHFGQMYPAALVNHATDTNQQAGQPITAGGSASSSTSPEPGTRHDSANHEADCPCYTGSRRKQNAPKRRKPKDNSTRSTDAECSGENPVQVIAPLSKNPGPGNPPQPDPSPTTEPQIDLMGTQMPAGGTPNSGVAYAYIAIPVSSLVPDASSQTQVPGTAVLPSPSQTAQLMGTNGNPTLSVTTPTIQKSDDNQAIDLSSEAKRQRQDNICQLSSQSSIQYSGQSAPRESLPLNPFRQHSALTAREYFGVDGNNQNQHLHQSNTIGIGSSAEVQSWVSNRDKQLCDENEKSGKIPNTFTAAQQSQDESSTTRRPQVYEHAGIQPSVNNIPSPQLQAFLELQSRMSQQAGGYGTGTLRAAYPTHGNAAQMFVPMRVPVNVGPVQNSALPEAHAQRPLPVPANSDPEPKAQPGVTSGKKPSQFIDLTDENDDVEDVYSPYDYDVTDMNKMAAVAMQHPHVLSLGHKTEQRTAPGELKQNETLQEEQMRLMDNVTKLAELHCEVGALINESTHLLDTLAPSSEPSENHEVKKKTQRKKNCKTGRKLVKYDHKGRRIFKFHEYCPTREQSKIIISSTHNFQ